MRSWKSRRELYGLRYLWQRVVVDVDYVVEEARRDCRDLLQRLEVEFSVLDHRGDVYRAEVAGLVRVERGLAAGVRAHEFAEVRRRVAAVDSVEEDYPRVAGAPRGVGDFLKQRRLFAVRVGDGLFHEAVEDADGDVEVRYRAVLVLAVDEFPDVGMVDVEYPHVRAAAHAALLDGLGRLVEEPHERDGAGGAAVGRVDLRALAAELREVEARAAAALVYEHLLAQRLAYAFHRVFDADDEAGRELSVRRGASRVHQRRAVRQEAQRRHNFVELVGPFILLRERALRRRDVLRDADEHLFGFFHGVSVLVAPQVTVAQNILR